MVRAIDQDHETYKAMLHQLRAMNKEDSGSCVVNNRRSLSQSMVLERTSDDELVEDPRSTRSFVSKSEPPLPKQRIGAALDKDQPAPRSRLATNYGDKDSMQRGIKTNTNINLFHLT